jgi:hypothetical protein
MVNEKFLSIYDEPNVKHYNSNDVLFATKTKTKPKSKKQLIFEEYSHDINKPLRPQEATFSFRAIPILCNDKLKMLKKFVAIVLIISC